MGILSGIAWALFGGMYIKNEYDNTKFRKQDKQNSIQRDISTYYDLHGNIYDTKSDRKVYRQYINGQQVLVDTRTHKVVRNLSEEKEQKSIQEAKQAGKGYYQKLFPEFNRWYYVEIETGRRFEISSNHSFITHPRYYISYFIPGNDTRRERMQNITVDHYIRLGGWESAEWLRFFDEHPEYRRGLGLEQKEEN